MMRGIAAHALADQPPPGPLAIAVVARLQIDFAGDVAGDDRARAHGMFAHHIHRQIVHHPAIHQQMAVIGDRRQDAGQRHAGAQAPATTCPRDAHGCGPVVRSEETQKNGFGNSSMRTSPKFSLQHGAGLLAAHQRDQRQGEIVERIVGDEDFAHPLGQFLARPIPAPGPRR